MGKGRKRRRRSKKERQRRGRGRKQEGKVSSDMEGIKVKLPLYKKIILFSKVSAVFIFAVGLEMLVLGNVFYAFLLMLIAVIIMVTPIKVKIASDDDGSDS